MPIGPIVFNETDCPECLTYGNIVKLVFDQFAKLWYCPIPDCDYNEVAQILIA